MHRSRINGILIDCDVDDIQSAAMFWAEALGRPIDPDHPGTRGNYVMLEDRPGEIGLFFDIGIDAGIGGHGGSGSEVPCLLPRGHRRQAQ